MPIAGPNKLGGVKVGSGLNITADGTLSATGGGGGVGDYLPLAGGTMSGDIVMNDGTNINFDQSGSIYNDNGSVVVKSNGSVVGMGTQVKVQTEGGDPIQIKNVANATENGDAVNKGQMDGELDPIRTDINEVKTDITNIKNGTDALPYVKKSGDTMTGPLNFGTTGHIEAVGNNLTVGAVGSPTIAFHKGASEISFSGTLKGQTVGGNQIKNIKDPVDAQDAATKAYVDANAGGISVYTYSRNQNVPIGGSGYTLSSDIIIPEGFQPADTNNPTACLMYNFNKTTASRCLFLGGPITYDSESRTYNINLHWYRNTQDTDVIGNYSVNFIIFIKKV